MYLIEVNAPSQMLFSRICIVLVIITVAAFLLLSPGSVYGSSIEGRGVLYPFRISESLFSQSSISGTDLPSQIMVPHLGVAFSLDFPLLFVDSLRIAGDFFDTRYLRQFVNSSISDDLGANFRANSRILECSALKELSIPLIDLFGGAGFTYSSGTVSVEDNAGGDSFSDSWSFWGANYVAGVGVGLPFFKVYGQLRHLAPLFVDDPIVEVRGFGFGLGIQVKF